MKMTNSYDAINTKLRKRLDQLRDHAEPYQKFRLLKRYLSHFVRLVRYGRLFEASFDDHLQMVVSYLNNRYPINLEDLGTVIKTLCVVCCITVVPYQTVVIALQGLLEIFERISSKETLNVLQRCKMHFKRLILHVKNFKYVKIQMQLFEFIYISSLAYAKPVERKGYVIELSEILGISCIDLLDWKSFQATEESRKFLVRLQQEHAVNLNVYSVPVENCRINAYSFTKLNANSILWLDINFRPATIYFAAAVVVNHGKNYSEMTINIEIMHNNVDEIELVDSNVDLALKINYTGIHFYPNVVDVDQKGCLIFKLSPELDCSHLRDEVLPSIRMGRNNKENSAPLRLDGLQNISLQHSFTSATAVSTELDQSERLQEYRDAIKQHQEMRCQLLNDINDGESDKENKMPNVTDQPNVIQDVQRLRVFEALRNDCQRQIENDLSKNTNRKNFGHKRSNQFSKKLAEKLNSNEISERKRLADSQVNYNEIAAQDSNEQQPPKTNESSAKKRKLYDNHMLENELNASQDSQIQRNIYVEGKLVNTVKPMKAQEEKINVVAECKDHNVSSSIESSEEFQQSIKAYIENNGIFGITQQKVLDKKLEKNIRKVNRMVDRSARKFFRREPPSENPYDFNEPSSKKLKKQSANQRKRATTRKEKGKFNNTDREFLPYKAAKNKANVSRNKTQMQVNVPQPIPIKTEPLTKRKSLPRKAKPSVLVDLISDTDDEDKDRKSAFIPTELSKRNLHSSDKDIFQGFNISSIESQQSGCRRSDAERKDSAHKAATKSTALEIVRKSLQASTDKQNIATRRLDKPCTETVENVDNNAILVKLRDNKTLIENSLQKTATKIIEQEKLKTHNGISSSSSEKSIVGIISMDGMALESCTQNAIAAQPKLTKESIEKHLLNERQVPIPQSLEISGSSIHPVPGISSNSCIGIDVAKYNIEYACRNFMLNKYIVETDFVDVRNQQDENVTKADNAIISVARDPSLTQSVSCISLSTNYPATKNITTRKKHAETESIVETNDKPRVSIGLQNTGSEMIAPRVKTAKAPAAKPLVKEHTILDSVMLAKFKEKIHQELNPALSELENKIDKLHGVHKVFEQLSTNFHAKEISMKCKEIVTLEKKLDKLLDDVVVLCKDSKDRSDHVYRLGKNLTKYDETKRKDYAEQLEVGRQEMPLILNDCIKDVWNEQVYNRKLQLELLLNKMLM